MVTESSPIADSLIPGDASPNEFPDVMQNDELGQPVATVNDILNASWQILAGSSDADAFLASSFVVDDVLLATNAHVVEAVADVLVRGGTAIAVQDETGEIVGITRAWVHPDYDGDTNITSTADVGVLEVDSFLGPSLVLADIDTLRELAIFDELRMCGFPGDVALAIDIEQLLPGDVFRPRATCFKGSLTSLRPFDPSEPATPKNTTLIQHDMPTTGGTSGSPIFNEVGAVVAINSSGTTNEGGLNRFAVRSDLLRDLLDLIEREQLDPVDIALVDLPPQEAPPTSLSDLRSGQWIGTTAQGKTISFRVEGDLVDDIAFGYIIDDSLYCSQDIDVDEERCALCVAPIAGCNFVFAWDPLVQINHEGNTMFFVFVDGCLDTTGESLSGRLSAFWLNCVGHVSDVPWTAHWTSD